jgi:hypothetical protein
MKLGHAAAVVAIGSLLGCEKCGKTREPPKLFESKEHHPVVRGCALGARAFAVGDGTVIAYDRLHLGIANLDALDTSIDEGFREALGKSEWPEEVTAMSGRLDDLWVIVRKHFDVQPRPNESFHRLVHRKGGKWTAVAPIAKDTHYNPPVLWRGGAFTTALVLQGPANAEGWKVVGFDLPPGADPARVFPRPNDYSMRPFGLETGEIVFAAFEDIYILGPNDEKPRRVRCPESPNGEVGIFVSGVSRATFRVEPSINAYWLDGFDLARDPNGSRVHPTREDPGWTTAFDGETFWNEKDGVERGRKTNKVFECPKPRETEEAPLAWGKRPPKEAELYPALEGACQGLTVHAVLDATYVVHSGRIVGRVTDDGFDFDVSKGLADALAKEDLPSDYVFAVSGRAEDLWVNTESGGSIFREAHLFRRRVGQWKPVAPLGRKDRHYLAPVAFKGGAVGFALPTEYSNEPTVMLGFDLPKPLPAQKVVGPMQHYGEMVALEDGSVVAVAGPIAEIFGPDDLTASKLKDDSAGLALHIIGRSRKHLRVYDEKSRWRLEGRKLVPEEVENATEWRRNGSAVQRLVGAGYHDVDIGDRKVSSFEIAHDGEVFVVAAGKDANDVVLFRSKRPRETFRCTEHGEVNGEWGPATASGIEPWPPRADATCRAPQSPFVVAFRYAEKEQVPNEFPKASSVLAGEGVAIEKWKSGTRFVVGAWAKDYDAALRIRDVLAKGLRIEPEIVCATRSDREGR